MKKRQQLYIDHHALYVGDGIGGFDGFKIVEYQIQWEGEIDVANGNLHTCLLGCYLGNFIDSPVLDWRQIEQ